MTNVLLWVAPNFFPQVGGIQRYNFEIVRELSKTVSIHLVIDEKAVFPAAESSSIVIHRLKGLLGSVSETRQQQLINEIKTIIEQTEPAIVHAGDAGALTLLGEHLTAKLVVTAHGNDFSSPWQVVGKRKSQEVILKMLKKCDLIIAVSQHTQALLRTYGVYTPCVIIKNFVDVAKEYQPYSKADFLNNYKIAPSSIIMLTVGRLAARKGHMQVLRILRRLPPNVVWVVIGTGKESWKLKLFRLVWQVRKRAKYLGHVSDDTLRSWYQSCDIFILVPRTIQKRKMIDSEGYGLVFQEAMSFGKPIVTSTIGGCAEAVVSTASLLVNPQNLNEIYNAVNILLTDKNLRNEMGASASKFAISTGGWNKTVGMLLQQYQTLLGNEENTILRN